MPFHQALNSEISKSDAALIRVLSLRWTPGAEAGGTEVQGLKVRELHAGVRQHQQARRFVLS